MLPKAPSEQIDWQLTIFVDLDPTIASSTSLGRGNVNEHRALVRAGDYVIAAATVIVVPLKGELVTCSNRKSLCSSNVVDIAGHALGCDILDGVVVWRTSNVTIGAVSKALVDVYGLSVYSTQQHTPVHHTVDPSSEDSGVGEGQLRRGSKCN